MKQYYVISYKHTEKGVLTFWRANNAGYTTDLLQAGKYSEDVIKDKFSYYNNGSKVGKGIELENIAVPCEEVESMKIRHHVEKDFMTYVDHANRIKEHLVKFSKA